MSRRVHRSAAALVVCAALALSACSSDGDDEADATTTTEAGDDTATSVPQPVGPSTSVVDDGSEPDPAAEAVRERAESRNLTIDEIAEKIGTGRHSIIAAEKGKPSTSAAVYTALLWAYDLLRPMASLADPSTDEEGLALSMHRERARAQKAGDLDSDF